jgi:isoleucyl-tRNA synthetase
MEEKNITKSDAALREEAVLEFWRENKIFEKSVSGREGKKEFVFYEGPPTANGKPGIHHLEARAFKDAIPRYKTMRGFHVRRKGGWDTHGLPVELQVEKKLGLNSKKAIEEYGIAKFNQQCKENVWELLDVWKDFTKRIGYWTDLENPYVTYHNTFIESLWNIVKKVDEQKLLYKDYKVVPWCPRCGTALSSHELAQGYEDVKDLSITAKFKIVGFPNAYFLAWTTTPWTLPGNVGLAVGPDVIYVEAKVPARNASGIADAGGGDEILVLAKERLSVIEGPYEIIAEHKGSEMVGMQYEPLFPYLEKNISDNEKPKLVNAFKVYTADFVTTTDGTGIVHTAVMYGQEDFELGTKVGLPKLHLVNLEGKFIKDTDFLEGRFVKEKDENGKPTLDVDIIKYLTEKNLFFKKENYAHSYPHCWRCHTALIYYARDSWYIRMSDPKIKAELISENKKINWEPSHIRDGRFGEWLREIKDWAISRERYWGTPLPVWLCESCDKRHVVGGLDDLKQRVPKSHNHYYVMRHGEAENNARNVYSSDRNKNHLTETGRGQVLKTAEELKHKKITKIYCSPFLRTRETAELVAETIGYPKDKIIFDERIRELEFGDFSERPSQEYWDFMAEKTWGFDTQVPGGESFIDGKRRFGDFLYEINKTHKGESILIVSHGLSVELIPAIIEGADKKRSLEIFNENIQNRNAELHHEHGFVPIPHNSDYELDFHRPFIDEVKLVCECGGQMSRTKEVMDVWFDSGAMPFAQDHYPFENKDWVEGEGFPADYISEAIDQTRGWFYTLHAVGVLMGRGRAYNNVICLGHLLDANGKKMSKSLGNVVDPWTMMDKYGVDTLRMWMYSVNQPGESKNFDEKTVVLLQQQVFTLLYNVLAFYELYRDKELENNNRPNSKNILDQWILTRLDELNKLSTDNLDNYKLLEPVRAIRDFVGDLSTWYLRRSRERIKDEAANPAKEDGARQTLYFVLKNLVKVMAPFAPFAAEDIWLKLKTDKDEESIHLSKWPDVEKVDLKISENMDLVRSIVSLGLEARQKIKIPVRQSLAKLEVKNIDFKREQFLFFKKANKTKEYLELIKDELNVKKVVENKNIEGEVLLDINITPALKAEGEYREFMREHQDKRKKLGLNPEDKMAMSVADLYKKYKIPPSLQAHMLRVAAVASLICDNFTETIDKEKIITTCLFHDMGNIIKSDLNYFPDFLQPEGMEYWQEVKDEFVFKYGIDEHEANLKIMREIGLLEDLVSTVDQNRFSLLCKHVESDDMIVKIMHYSDGRVNPLGVVSYMDRMEEARVRYEKKNKGREAEREKMVSCGLEIEKQIFAKCKIKPEDITDESVAPLIEELRNFMVK